MNDIDKTISQLLKSTESQPTPNAILEDAIMKSVYKQSDAQDRVVKLRKKSLLLLKITAGLLILSLFSVAVFLQGAEDGGLNTLSWMVSLLSIGLFYLVVTLHFTFAHKSKASMNR